jgi:hypothetical protein
MLTRSELKARQQVLAMSVNTEEGDRKARKGRAEDIKRGLGLSYLHDPQADGDCIYLALQTSLRHMVALGLSCCSTAQGIRLVLESLYGTNGELRRMLCDLGESPRGGFCFQSKAWVI